MNTRTEEAEMANKHTPSNPKDQRALLAKARKEKQLERGAKTFRTKSNKHGDGLGQSGQPRR